MKPFGPCVAAVLLTTSIALSACGPGTPSKDDLVSELVDSGAAGEDDAACIAGELLDADLSDKQFNAVGEGDDSSLNSEDLDDLEDELEAADQECGPSKDPRKRR